MNRDEELELRERIEELVAENKQLKDFVRKVLDSGVFDVAVASLDLIDIYRKQ